MIGVNAMKVKTQVKLFEYAIVLTICLGWLIVFGPQSYAQSTYGSVSGTITDTSGGAIADVQSR